MKKVIVVGSPGAGKSYFSKLLALKTGIKLIHLDNVWHKKDKTHISRDEFDAFLVETFKKESYILDGNYSRTMEVRFQNADTVFFLDYPLEVCLKGITERVGKERDDMPWAEEVLDEVFLQEVKNYPKEGRNQIYQMIEKYGKDKEIIIFSTRDEAKKYLETI